VPRSADRGRRPRVEPAKVAATLALLDARYPTSRCSLDHRNPFELVVAVALSAQCTDARVNIVTKDLFRECPDVEALARTPLPRIEALVKSTGFFRNKAKNLKGMAEALLKRHGGRVPADFDALTALPGVARKTANVVMGVGFGIASGVVVDTHVGRIVRRLGWTRHEAPEKVEADLTALLPKDRWIRFSHQLIDHGRAVCDARKPLCETCDLRTLCAFGNATSPPRGSKPTNGKRAPARARTSARASTTRRS
jgi:endonuclease III